MNRIGHALAWEAGERLQTGVLPADHGTQLVITGTAAPNGKQMPIR